jgi:hypothetical protein
MSGQEGGEESKWVHGGKFLKNKTEMTSVIYREINYWLTVFLTDLH